MQTRTIRRRIADRLRDETPEKMGRWNELGRSLCAAFLETAESLAALRSSRVALALRRRRPQLVVAAHVAVELRHGEVTAAVAGRVDRGPSSIRRARVGPSCSDVRLMTAATSPALCSSGPSSAIARRYWSSSSVVRCGAHAKERLVELRLDGPLRLDRDTSG